MNELITSLANCLITDTNGSDWERIEYTLAGVTTFWQENAELFYQEDQKSIETTDDDEDPKKSPMFYAKKLRQFMHESSPNKGAWYTFLLVIYSNGKFNVKFNYDDKPDLNIDIDEERYVWDFEKYPRDNSSTPSWLRIILDKYDK